jgi:acyl phosphate:glycerol-3-phosphate acyltransferase
VSPAVVAALAPIAYLLGTFPSAVIVAVGSGNPGASNIARVMGRGWGIAVFVLDGLKGAIPVAAALLLDHRAAGYIWLAAAILGHMFPINRRFQGGKGVSTGAGGMIVMWPWVSMVLFAVWFAVRRVTRKASLASLTIAVGLPIGIAIADAPAWELFAAGAIGLLVVARHTDNIRRLLRGNELSTDRPMQ